MTDEQKKNVESLRRQGKTPAEISRQLNLTVNTVRIYCSRHGLTDDALKGRRFCEQCGTYLPDAAGRRKRFCSNTCRMRWWNNHPEQVRRSAFYPTTCQACGKEFISYGNSHRKYCNRACYLAGRYGKNGMPDA